MKRFSEAKKNKFIFSKIFGAAGCFILLAGLLISTLASCKSAPAANPVNPLDLLDGESAIYFAIPTKADSELVATVIKNNVSSLSESDVKSVMDRISMVYAGILHSRNEMVVQCAVSCNIPTAFHSKIFSKKNGWEVAQYIPSGSSREFNLYENGDLTISLPDANTLCLGRDVTRMLDTYHLLSTPMPYAEVAKNKNDADAADYEVIDEDEVLDVSGGNPYIEDVFYEHLKSASDTVKFFAQKPQSFLSMLTGANLDLKLVYVMGEMRIDSNRETQYILDLDFQFKNERYVKPGKALLSLSFGLTDSNITVTNKNIKITGIKIGKNQLYKLLTFN